MHLALKISSGVLAMLTSVVATPGFANAQEAADQAALAPGFTRTHAVRVADAITTGAGNAGDRLSRTIPVPADVIVEALSRRDDDGPFVRVNLAFDVRYGNFEQAGVDAFVTRVLIFVRKPDGTRTRVHASRERFSFLGEASFDFGIDPADLDGVLEAGDVFDLELRTSRFDMGNDARPLNILVDVEFRLQERLSGR